MTDEETRAAQFRADQTAIAQARFRRRFSDFPSNAGSVTAFRKRWEPWIDPVRDWDPVEMPEEGRGLQIP